MNAIGTDHNWPSGPLNRKDTLLIGIGNSSRADDGLGWSFLEAVENEPGFEGDIEYRYQLQVEDAALMANYALVIIVDAFQGRLAEGFQWQACRPAPQFEFTTHALAPASVLFLCRDLYGATPTTYLLAIEGAEWGLKEGLSPSALANLNAALVSFRQLAWPAGKETA